MLVGLTRGSFNNNKVDSTSEVHDQYYRLSRCPFIQKQSMSLHYKGWCVLCLTQTALSQASLQPFFKARRAVTCPAFLAQFVLHKPFEYDILRSDCRKETVACLSCQHA